MSYNVQLKDTGSGGVILRHTKLFFTVFVMLNIPGLLGSQKWRAGGQPYKFYSDVLELLQLVCYFQLKDTAGSGGVVLRPTKLFLPIVCRADHFVLFDHPRFAWISKMAIWRPVLKVLIGRIRATTSAIELCLIERYVLIWKCHFKTYQSIFNSICHAEHPRFA